RVWDWLADKSRHAIDVVERYVDCQATDTDLHIVAKQAEDEWVTEFGNHHPSNAVYALSNWAIRAHDAAVGVAAEIVEAIRCEACVRIGVSLGSPAKSDASGSKASVEAGEAAQAVEAAAQCDLLRDIFHGPRRAVIVRSHWKIAPVVQLARDIYEEKFFHRLPILADALEEAGCTNVNILDHCRKPAEH